MELATSIVATVLPFVVLIGAFLLIGRRVRKVRETGRPTHPWSRRRTILVLAGMVVAASLLLGVTEGWRPMVVLMPLGWLATGFVLVYADRFLDRRISGGAPKAAGPMPFWWVFVWAAAGGATFGLFTAETATSPPRTVLVGLFVVLLVAAVAAFCLRFGLRPLRRR